MASKIRKGDQVIVIAGRDKGKRGEVLRALPKEHRLVVQGVNIVKRHQKPSQVGEGGIIAKEGSIDVSNVAHIDPVNGRPTRVGFKILDGGRKVRFAVRSGEVIDK